MESEIWMAIPGFERLYQVSDKGRVKSMEKTRAGGHNLLTKRTYPEKILSHGVSSGYCHVSLCKDSQIYQRKIHRLVAEAFIPNPENKPEVNHKDGIKTHNWKDNLEWATGIENVIHSYETGLAQGRKLGDHHFAKKIIDQKTGKEYDTVKEAAIAEGVAWSTLSSFMNNNQTVPISVKMKARLSKFVFQSL